MPAAAAGAKPVYARLPSLQQLSVDVNALPAEASSAAGVAGTVKKAVGSVLFLLLLSACGFGAC
jgi:hypothetical protein